MGILSHTRSLNRLRAWLGGLLGISCCLLIGCGSSPTPLAVSAKPLLPDSEPDAISYQDLVEQNGQVNAARKRYRIGIMVKFLGNPFWKSMAEGMRQRAAELGVDVDIRAALNELDAEGQLKTFMSLIDGQNKPDILLVSPLYPDNLNPGLARAESLGIPVINVDGALIERSRNWVGAPNYAKGVMAAEYVIQQCPQGGKFAIIMGLEGVYDAQQRTKGFAETLANSEQGTFIEAARVHCDWDLQKALAAVADIIQQHPDLVGIYCNNDTMVLGASEAINNAGKSDQVVVVGTDGIADAIESIRNGELDATIDPAPDQAGGIAVEIAVRVLTGEHIPRVVYAPQRLVTRDSL